VVVPLCRPLWCQLEKERRTLEYHAATVPLPCKKDRECKWQNRRVYRRINIFLNAPATGLAKIDWHELCNKRLRKSNRRLMKVVAWEIKLVKTKREQHCYLSTERPS
jgi:hypothetical protein